MKKNSFWVWYIPLLLIMCLFVYIKLEDLKTKNNTQTVLKIENISSEFQEIYKENDYSIYSKYQVNKYNNEEISTLLEQNKISIKDITDKMNLKDTLNDGGTQIYQNNDYYITKCNTLNGNKNIYISDKEEECK